MNRTSKWKGFEIPPQGCLLEQVIDLSLETGIAYERSCRFYKDFHVHDRLMLAFPRGACVMEVRECRLECIARPVALGSQIEFSLDR